MKKKKRRTRRVKLSSQYTYKPYNNGKCINPNCQSPRVGLCVGMIWGDGHTEDSLACHDCGLELPASVWSVRRRQRCAQRTLRDLERKLKAVSPLDEDASARLRAKDNRWRRAHGDKPWPEGDKAMAAKKKAKKSAGKKKDKAQVLREKAGLPRCINLYVPARHIGTASKLLKTAKSKHTGYTELAWSILAKGLK